MKKDNLVPDYEKLALSPKKPSGHLLINNRHVADTVRCCHCGTNWVYIKGSGKLRGYCRIHKDLTCGRYECTFCIDSERRIEAVERGETLKEVLKELESKSRTFFIDDSSKDE